jgi:hypothetical protein
MTEETSREDPVKAAAQCKSNAAHALFAATAQIGLALRESQDPVEDLGAMITRVAETLVELRAIAVEKDSERAAMSRLLDRLQADLFEGIQRMQFYDRMVQHLAHLQDYLVCVANELVPKQAHEKYNDAWEALHAKLRARLISDEQRRLFDRFLHPDKPMKVSAQIMRAELSQPGSLEFF